MPWERRTNGCEGNLSKIPNKGKNLTVMEKERATQDEMNSGYRPPLRGRDHGGRTSCSWKGLTMSQYDGTTDLEEHVDVFTTQTGLYTSDDAILCRVFPTSLKGLALNWFTRLPPNSIDCFDTLVTRFGIQFATNKPHHLTSLALVNIRQEKGESLRDFMERFGKISLNISNLNPEVAMHHLETALKPGPFVDSLCKKPVSNLDELRTRATKFMQMEELKEFRSMTQSDTREKK